MAIRRFNGNEVNFVNGGVGVVKGSANSFAPKRIVFRNADELNAFADFLENHYGAGLLTDDEGETFYIKETADEYRDDARSYDWRRCRNYFLDVCDAEELYDGFKKYNNALNFEN